MKMLIPTISFSRIIYIYLKFCLVSCLPITEKLEHMRPWHVCNHASRSILIYKNAVLKSESVIINYDSNF